MKKIFVAIAKGWDESFMYISKVYFLQLGIKIYTNSYM